MYNKNEIFILHFHHGCVSSLYGKNIKLHRTVLYRNVSYNFFRLLLRIIVNFLNRAPQSPFFVRLPGFVFFSLYPICLVKVIRNVNL